MTGGSAATQGNETLIPTPSLPSCPAAICGVAPVPGPKPISDSNGRNSVHERQTDPPAVHVQLIEEPEIESATEYLTIVRWKIDNPGGSPVHFGIVHYGVDPNRLTDTAESPLRLNSGHTTTLFRVLLNNLRKGTIYYFKVDSKGADGVGDGVVSPIKSFAIR